MNTLNIGMLKVLNCLLSVSAIEWMAMTIQVSILKVLFG